MLPSSVYPRGGEHTFLCSGQSFLWHCLSQYHAARHVPHCNSLLESRRLNASQYLQIYAASCRTSRTPAARALRDVSLISRSVDRRASASHAGVAQMKSGSRSVITGNKCFVDGSILGVFTISQARRSHAMHIHCFALRISGTQVLSTPHNNSRCRAGSTKPLRSSSG